MVEIQGFSDDLVHLVVGTHEDEINACDKDVHFKVRPKGRQEGVHVVMHYGRQDATWGATIHRLEEDAPIPWPVTVCEGKRGYSVRVCIDAEADMVVVGMEVHNAKH
jgi:hypothetical protein